MKQFKRLAHAVWRCKYHIVWCPKYRFWILKGEVGRLLREIIRQLCEWKKIEILEGNIQVDHIHLVLDIPQKYLDEEQIRRYVRHQLHKDKKAEQVKLWKD